jgi:hypothetical protein
MPWSAASTATLLNGTPFGPMSFNGTPSGPTLFNGTPFGPMSFNGTPSGPTLFNGTHFGPMPTTPFIPPSSSSSSTRSSPYIAPPSIPEFGTSSIQQRSDTSKGNDEPASSLGSNFPPKMPSPVVTLPPPWSKSVSDPKLASSQIQTASNGASTVLPYNMLPAFITYCALLCSAATYF